MKSTMGAELSPAEITQITLAWEGLLALASSLPSAAEGVDTPEMCQILAHLVGRCHETRRVIGDCWHAANKRAFPVQHAAKRATVNSALQDLDALGITKQEILDIIGRN
jgi:hypothetical protein